MKKAVMIYGAPGAGKGTQANLLSWSKGWTHFDTGKYLEQLVHDPVLKKNKTIQRERKNFDAGILVDPAFVLNVTSKKTKEIAAAGFSVVFSGSPRTLFEAFGNKKYKGLISILEKSYGRKNIYVILLKVKPETSIYRNSHRVVCSVCGNVMIYADKSHKHTVCALCGGGLRRRTLDKPEIIKVRLKEYSERTAPIISELKKRGYNIINIDGEKLPFKVFQSVLKRIK